MIFRTVADSIFNGIYFYSISSDVMNRAPHAALSPTAAALFQRNLDNLISFVSVSKLLSWWSAPHTGAAPIEFYSVGHISGDEGRPRVVIGFAMRRFAKNGETQHWTLEDATTAVRCSFDAALIPAHYPNFCVFDHCVVLAEGSLDRNRVFCISALRPLSQLLPMKPLPQVLLGADNAAAVLSGHDTLFLFWANCVVDETREVNRLLTQLASLRAIVTECSASARSVEVYIFGPLTRGTELLWSVRIKYLKRLCNLIGKLFPERHERLRFFYVSAPGEGGNYSIPSSCAERATLQAQVGDAITVLQNFLVKQHRNDSLLIANLPYSRIIFQESDAFFRGESTSHVAQVGHFVLSQLAAYSLNPSLNQVSHMCLTQFLLLKHPPSFLVFADAQIEIDVQQVASTTIVNFARFAALDCKERRVALFTELPTPRQELENGRS